MLLKFGNGNFLSISEGSDLLGSMVVSLGSGPSPITTMVVPAKTDSLFLKILASKISAACRGISIISYSTRGELDSRTARELMAKVMEMIDHT